MLPTVIVFGHSVDLQHINKYIYIYIYNQQTCFSWMGLYGPSTTPQGKRPRDTLAYFGGEYGHIYLETCEAVDWNKFT
jgi:hypothetical protein